MVLCVCHHHDVQQSASDLKLPKLSTPPSYRLSLIYSLVALPFPEAAF